MSQQPQGALRSYPEPLIVLVEYRCEDCGATFKASPRSQAKRCIPCRKKARRDSAKRSMGRLRARRAGRGGVRCADDRISGQGLRSVALFCGHTKIFRVSPQVGEKLLCESCNDWVEYLGRDPVCSAGKHIISRYNTIVSSTGRKYCQQCVNDDEE
jgi:DNA-directed RNA polymerase subunit RPC12/RpoP